MGTCVQTPSSQCCLQAKRYVTRERVEQMLNTEYDVVEKNLRGTKGEANKSERDTIHNEIQSMVFIIIALMVHPLLGQKAPDKTTVFSFLIVELFPCLQPPGEEARFFAFATTLAAKAYMSDRECEGSANVDVEGIALRRIQNVTY